MGFKQVRVLKKFNKRFKPNPNFLDPQHGQTPRMQVLTEFDMRFKPRLNFLSLATVTSHGWCLKRVCNKFYTQFKFS